MLIRRATAEDAEAIARVHVESWRAAYAGIVPDEFLAALSVERRAAQWRETVAPERQSYLVVAEDEGAVIGFAVAGPGRESDATYTGELYAIYLQPERQGQGVGRALVREIARELQRRGLGSMLVWVLAENPARKFYEALGGQYVREKEIEIGGKALIEVAYGWKSLAPLIE